MDLISLHAVDESHGGVGHCTGGKIRSGSMTTLVSTFYHVDQHGLRACYIDVRNLEQPHHGVVKILMKLHKGGGQGITVRMSRLALIATQQRRSTLRDTGSQGTDDVVTDSCWRNRRGPLGSVSVGPKDYQAIQPSGITF